jgi:hypothetical protein
MLRKVAAWLLVSTLAPLCTAQDKSLARFGSTVVIPSGLRGLIYDLPPGQDSLPDFSTLRPVGAIYTTRLNVPAQDFSVGFPGVTNRFEWFAIDYSGRFWIEKPGRFQFRLTSDDGSKLYIDNKVLLDVDGIHPPATANQRIKLGCGLHHIRVSYYQGPRYQVALQLSVSGGGKRWRLFDTDEFKPPGNPEDWVCNGKPVPYDPNRRIDVRAAAFLFSQSTDASQVSIVVSTPENVRVPVLTVIKDAAGVVVDKFMSDMPESVFSHPAHLPPGRYTIEAAVLDPQASQGSATAEIIVDPPPQSGGPQLSSLMLVDRVEPAADADAADPLVFDGKRVVPHLAPELDGSAKPTLFFVVYPDPSNSAKPNVEVESFDAGRLLSRQPATLLAPNASGAIPMLVAITPRPGDTDVKVTVTQGDESATRTLHYRVATAAVPPAR